MLDTQAQEAKQSAPPTPTLPEAADFIETQHDRRNPPQNRRQQKSGSGARPEPPGVDQEVEAPLY